MNECMYSYMYIIYFLFFSFIFFYKRMNQFFTVFLYASHIIHLFVCIDRWIYFMLGMQMFGLF